MLFRLALVLFRLELVLFGLVLVLELYCIVQIGIGIGIVQIGIGIGIVLYCSDWYWYCIVQIGIGIVLFRLALVLFRLELGDTTADFSTSTMTMLWLAVSFYNSQKVTVIISNLLHAWKYKQ